MFCPSCGTTLAQAMKYCNRCGSHINATDTEVIQILEKRMDSEMEGLFWITVFALGFVFGGIVVLKKLSLSPAVIVAYLSFCAIAYLSYFGLGVWQLRRLSKTLKQESTVTVLPPAITNELPPVSVRASFDSMTSVTENTTRTLEPVLRN